MRESLESPKRIDLHCHSRASNEPGEAALEALGCPESFSPPQQVLRQARQRGMNFITLTDHDSLAGVEELLHDPNVFSGEELTCFFPEDHCKIHLLVWGLTSQQHTELQARAQDIYQVASYVANERLAHSVAHPLYRQNDRLERWHLERLMLLFKGIECLNGSHSLLHRESLEGLLKNLNATQIAALARSHHLEPLWPEPWIKSHTGGSDDHSLLNIGRTWTEFPPETQTIAQVLEALRTGRTRPGGESGTSLKLAHNFLGISIRYFGEKLLSRRKPDETSLIIQALGGNAPRISPMTKLSIGLKRGIKKGGQLLRWNRPSKSMANQSGTGFLGDLFVSGLQKNLSAFPDLGKALNQGHSPLGEHQELFKLVNQLNRHIANGMAQKIETLLGKGQAIGLFDLLGTVAAHQFFQLPYYFALFHQNRERHLLERITGQVTPMARHQMHLGVFSDTFDQINGVARHIQDLGIQAQALDYQLTVHTCSAEPRLHPKGRKNFTPLWSGALPGYPELELSLPPVLEIMEWADRQQFNAIHVHTPGPMGLVGILVAKMLRVPLVMTYHTDFPAYMMNLTGDYRLTSSTRDYMTWFYGQAQTVLTRSRAYEGHLNDLEIKPGHVALSPAGVDLERFNPNQRDEAFMARLKISQPRRLLYVGRISKEKNLEMLAQIFREICRHRSDTALILAGDGPYRGELQKHLRDLPAYFMGSLGDAALAPLYAGSDLLIFPSRTDTMGQVVIEAQASGLPVLVSDEGGPREMMDDGISGMMLPGQEIEPWVRATLRLLEDETLRQRMSRNAAQRAGRFAQSKSFQVFWEEHLQAIERHRDKVARTSQKVSEKVSSS